MIIQSLISRTLSFREECLGFSHKEVGAHSFWSGFSMELFLSRLYPEIIMIIGRCFSNYFIMYKRNQVRNLSKGISEIMVATHVLYTIPES